MERRVRLAWSPKSQRSWCPGASLPPEVSADALPAATGFLRVQGLLRRLRQRTAEAQASRATRGQPAAPLPRASNTPADASQAASDASARDSAR